MTRSDPARAIRRATWRVAAAALFAGFSIGAPLAQQPAAEAGASAHAAASEVDRGFPLSQPARRSTKPDAKVQALRLPKMPAVNDRPIIPARSNAVGRNAIGVPLEHRDAVPAAPLVGHVTVGASAPLSGGSSGAVLRAGETVPVRVPNAQPLVLSRGTIGGASFTRPGTTLMPLGGPAKTAATGINGTTIRPKH